MFNQRKYFVAKDPDTDSMATLQPTRPNAMAGNSKLTRDANASRRAFQGRCLWASRSGNGAGQTASGMKSACTSSREARGSRQAGVAQDLPVEAGGLLASEAIGEGLHRERNEPFA